MRAGALRGLAGAFLLVAALVVDAASSPAAAQRPDDPTESALISLHAAAENAAKILDRGLASDEGLVTLREDLERRRDEARAIIAAQDQKLAPLQRELAALGPPPADGETEDAALAAQRNEVSARIALETGLRARANAASDRFSVQLDEINDQLRARLVSRVLERSRSPLDPRLWLDAATDATELGRDLAVEFAGRVGDPRARAQALATGPLALLALVTGAALLIVARRRVVDWVERVARDPAGSREARIGAAAAGTIARLALPVAAFYLTVFAIGQSALVGPKLGALVTGAGLGIGALIATYAFSSAYFAPEAPALRVAGLDDARAGRAHNAAMTLALVLAIIAALSYAFADLGVDAELLIAANLLLSLTASAAMLRLRSAYTPSRRGAAEEVKTPEESEAEGEGGRESSLLHQLRWTVRFLLLVAALLAPTLAAVGYLAASTRLTAAVIQSLGVLGLAALIYALVEGVAESAEERLGPKARRFARLAPLVTGFALTLVALPLFAMAWGARWADVAFSLRSMGQGFTIGGVTISPGDFLAFGMVFGLGYLLTTLAQRVLRVSVLPQLEMEAGARSAITSGVGYLGIIAAFFLAVSSTGIDLSNLAIVAGALSVGIGFGLQTIVSNFVSGVILLIERPINVGDWIDVNGKQGTVRKINVRSTEIQLFDRSDYIVPNADLIANPVTNYTRRNTTGRLILKVGVAYSSDLRRVETALREIGLSNPNVLRRPAPQVLFRAFGPDALDFELRVFLRDVGNSLGVETDLNFKIAERFRAEGFEIPFGQRDVWLRNPETLAEALRRAEATSAAAGPRKRRDPGRGEIGEADADADGEAR